MDKQIVEHLYNVIQLINKKTQSTNTSSNIAEPSNDHIDDKNQMQNSVWFHLYVIMKKVNQ